MPKGQMALTGARWCDFVVYTTRGLYVRRVLFNRHFWTELHQKLVSYYFNHFSKFASAKRFHGSCQVNNSNECQIVFASSTV